MEKDILFKQKVKYTGTFSYKELYRIIYEWLMDHGYDVSEKSYKEIIGAGNSKEVDIEWEAWRKITDYFRYYLHIQVQIFRMTEVEVEIDGVKQKMNKGAIEIGIKSILEKDYESRWITRAPIAFLRTFYDRYLIKERIEKFVGELIGEMGTIADEIKSFLNIQGTR